jgi:hypothetical protein
MTRPEALATVKHMYHLVVFNACDLREQIKAHPDVSDVLSRMLPRMERDAEAIKLLLGELGEMV